MTESEGAVTAAIDHYYGIFKFVHCAAAKSSFLQARKFVSEADDVKAIEKFQECLKLCDNNTDKKTVSLVIEEYNKFLSNNKRKLEAQMNDPFIDWAKIVKRNVCKFEERHDHLPQGIFLMKLQVQDCFKEMVVLGRKTISELWRQNLIPEIFCSQIREDMLLGVLGDWRVSDEKIIAYYHPFDTTDKRVVFSSAVSGLIKDATYVDIVYPFPLLPLQARKELTSPAEGWDVDETFDQNLSHGEAHIREWTIEILHQLRITEKHTLYDPACSTGVFLNSLKECFPKCKTIGQDLSEKMCNVAKTRVDEVYCGNAMSPKIPTGTADCVVVRFLNSEVVTTQEASALLRALLPTVIKGGILIAFGHTPVLLSGDDFRNIAGFKLIRTVGVTKDSKCMFQYYIIRRYD